MIYLNRNDENLRSFAAVKALIESGCIKDSAYVRDDVIVDTLGNEFTVGDEFSFETYKLFEINTEGASWFSNFRSDGFVGENATENGDSLWHSLINKVAHEYHHIHSFLRFRRNDSENKTIIEKGKKSAEKIVRALFGDRLGKKAIRCEYEPKNVSYYGINLKIDINDEKTGEPKTILPRLYLTKDPKTGKFRSLRHSDAEEVDNYLPNAIDDRNSASTAMIDKDVVENIFNQVMLVLGVESKKNEIVDGVDLDENFLVSEEDNEIIRQFEEYSGIRNLSGGNVQIFSISEVEWKAYDFMIYVDNKPFVDIEFSNEGEANVYCGNCLKRRGERVEFVKFNKVMFPEDAEVTEDIILNLDRDDLGLKAEQLRLILKEGVLAHHLKKVNGCRQFFSRAMNCDLLCCDEDLVTLSDGKKTFELCKNCHYEQIVYQINGEPVMTNGLKFAENKHDLVTKEEISRCQVCGKIYTTSHEHGKTSLCQTCSSLVRASKAEHPGKEFTSTFKRYKQLIPVGKRFFRAKRILAVEDSTRVVFRVGKGNYFFLKKADVLMGDKKGIRLTHVRYKE